MQRDATMTLLVLTLLAAAPVGATERSTLSLAQAHDLALRHNPTMKNLDEVVYQAELVRYRVAAILLPNLSANGSITRNDQEIEFGFPDFNGLIDARIAEYHGTAPPAMGPGEFSTIQELWGQQVGVTANITLFNPRSIPLLKNAYDHIDASRLQKRHQRNELLFAVTASYFGVRSAEEALAMALENLETAGRFHELAKARQSVGDAVRVEVLRSEITVAEAERRLKEAEDAVRLAYTGLGFLIGRHEPFRIAAPEAPAAPGGELAALTEQALRDRLDLQALRIQNTMAERNKTDTWAKFLPTFDLTYNWTWNSAEGFAGDNDSSRLIFGARWSLFEGGSRIVELEERESQVRQAGLMISQLSLDIREQVEKDLVGLEQARRNVTIARKQLALAEENHKLITAQYQNGLATSLDLQDATNTLSRARRAQVLEALKRDLGVLKLEKSVGVEVRPQV